VEAGDTRTDTGRTVTPPVQNQHPNGDRPAQRYNTRCPRKIRVRCNTVQLEVEML
jgi:hypothetical protein